MGKPSPRDAVSDFLKKDEFRSAAYVESLGAGRSRVYKQTLRSIHERVRQLAKEGWELLPACDGEPWRSRFIAEQLPDDWCQRIFGDAYGIYLFRSPEGVAKVSYLWSASLYLVSITEFADRDPHHLTQTYYQNSFKALLPQLTQKPPEKVEAWAVLWLLNTPPTWMKGCRWIS